jgi:hypothetical protein
MELRGKKDMNQENKPQSGTGAGDQPSEELKKEPAAQAAESKPAESAGESDKKQAASAPKKAPFYKKQKFRHGSAATAFTAVFIAAVVLLNVVVGMLSDRFPSMNADLTKTGSNSLSEEAGKIVDKVKIPVTVTICATRQQVESNQVQSESGASGYDYSQVGTIAEKIAERNPKIKVEYRDLDKNPDFASKYKSDGLQAGSVVVSSDKRHRALSLDGDLFQQQYSSDYTSSTTLSNVDSAFASALNAVISDVLPIAAFDTGHSEKMDVTTVKKVLQNNGFETKDFNLITDKVPAKAQLVILGCPTKDYTDEEITKLENFLKDQSLAGDRSLLVTASPGEPSLPKFASFLEEWGLKAQTDTAVLETDAQKYAANNPLYLLGEVQSDLDLGGSKSGYDFFFVPNACPVTTTFENNNSRTTYTLVKSSETAYLYKDEKSAQNPQTAAQSMAALSQQSVQAGGKARRANVMLFGSTMMFSAGAIDSSTFSNGSYFVDLTRYGTGLSGTDTKVETQSTVLNPQDILMNAAQARFLGLGIFTLLIPLAVAVAGIVVHHKRRAL